MSREPSILWSSQGLKHKKKMVYRLGQPARLHMPEFCLASHALRHKVAQQKLAAPTAAHSSSSRLLQPQADVIKNSYAHDQAGKQMAKVEGSKERQWWGVGGRICNLLLLLQAQNLISGCCRPAGTVRTDASYPPTRLCLHTLLSLHLPPLSLKHFFQTLHSNTSAYKHFCTC